VKEIGLPDLENLNAHVRPHRTRRGVQIRVSEPHGCVQRG